MTDNLRGIRRGGWLGLLGVWLAIRYVWPFPQMPWWMTMGLLYAFLMIAALIIIGVKLAHVFDPEDAIYADQTGGWHWRRWGVVVLPVGAMWGLSIALGSLLGAVGLHAPPPDLLLMVLAAQILLVGLGEELFFREAAIRVAAGNVVWLIGLAVVAFGLIHWQGGPAAVMTAMGAGAIYLSARLMGVPILVVAVAHGVTNVLFRYVVWHDLDSAVVYAVGFMLGCFVIAAVMLGTIGVYQRPRIGQR